MMRPLTTEETDRILERFDATDPALQRKILAELLWEAHKFKELVGILRAKQKEYGTHKCAITFRQVKAVEQQVDRALITAGYQPFRST